MSKVELQSPQFRIIYHEFDRKIIAEDFVTKGKGVYQTCVKEFLWWLEMQGITKITRVESSTMIDFYEYIISRPKRRTEGVLSDSSINQHMFSLSLLFNYLLDTKQVTSTVIIPKNSIRVQKERNIASLDEIDLLYKYCTSKLEKAILGIAYGCGLRRSELQDLNTNDINYQNGILTVREGKYKKRRDVPMSDAVIRDLKDYLISERANYLKDNNRLELSFFINNKGKRMHGDKANDLVKEIIQRTKNEELIKKEITLHCLRHSIAGHLLDNGADIEFIRDFLGHSEIDTSSIYARKNKQMQKLRLNMSKL